MGIMSDILKDEEDNKDESSDVISKEDFLFRKQ